MSEFTITIKMTGDSKHQLQVTSDMTVIQLKEKFAKDLDVSVDRQRLIFSGKVLKDNDTLETYKIKEGHSIHLVKGAAKSSTTGNTSSNTNNTTTTNNNNNNTTTSVPSNLEAGQNAFDPLAGLTDARYAGYNIPMPTMDQLGFGSDGMQLPPEGQMEQMMDNPLFQESMRSMLSNPQMLDYMIQQSPQLRSMGPAARELLQSDYVKNLLTNPQAMRSMMEFQRAMGGNGLSNNGSSFPAPGNVNNESTENNTSASASATTNANVNANTSNPFASLFGGSNPGAGFGAGLGGNPFMNPALNPNLMNLFGNPAGAAAGTNNTTTDTRPPEEIYATQLRQLNDMGFFEFERNITALKRSGGSVEGAIEMLFNGSI